MQQESYTPEEFQKKYPGFALPTTPPAQQPPAGGQPSTESYSPEEFSKMYPGIKIPSAPQGTQQSMHDITKDTIIGSAPSDELKAKKTPYVSMTPGYHLAQGLGYAFAGKKAQEGLMQAQQSAIDIQSKLLQRIKEKKANGEDTSRLDAALNDITNNIQDTGSKVSNAGTGGLTSSDILKSAGSLAALPVTSYASGALRGGGLLNTGRGLETGLLTKAEAQIPSALRSNAVNDIIKQKYYGQVDGASSLSRQELKSSLTEALNEMQGSQMGTRYEKEIRAALSSLDGVQAKRHVGKYVASAVGGALLTKIFGNKIGGLLSNLL